MNHYKWLSVNLPIFFNNLGININICESLITANGDKCYGAKEKFERNGLHFYQGCAIYLLSSLPPYCNEVRQTVNGWVDPFEWIINNKERFIPHLPFIIE